MVVVSASSASSPPASEPFSTPHTVSVLVAFTAALAYASLHAGGTGPGGGGAGGADNITYGLFAAAFFALVFCTEHLRDTLFVRPHPALWRAVTGIGLLYAMACVFLLFQPVAAGRALMRYVDPSLSAGPPAQQSYGDKCELTLPNLWHAMDIFVLAHVLGWVGKMVMFRDFKLCVVLSLLFELMEYTFEFLQPNFVECWWDHWLLDFALCNMAGILAGQALLSYLNSRTYDWAGRSLAEIPTIKGKALRVLQQFTPASWTPYSWGVLREPRRLAYVLVICAGAMVVELDAFFLKDIFWLPPSSVANVYRLLIWVAVGMVGLRDMYAFMDDPHIKRLGSTAWVMVAMMAIELLVVIKFAPELYKGKAIPAVVVALWAVAAAAGGAWLWWWFVLHGRGTKAAALEAALAEAAPTRRRRATSSIDEAPAPKPTPAPTPRVAEREQPPASAGRRAGGGSRELAKLLQIDMKFDLGPALADIGSRRRK